MSKRAPTFYSVFAALLVCFQIFTNASGQTTENEVSVVLGPSSSAEFQIRSRGRASNRDQKNISFLRSIAGIGDLGLRVSDLQLFKLGDQPVAYKKFAAGEFIAETDFDSVSYRIDLTPTKARASAAHVSWMAGDTAILMLSDALPQMRDGKQAKITFPMPKWPVYTAEKEVSPRTFTVTDPDDAVFYLGSGWRLIKRQPNSPRLLISGTWLFTDDEAGDMVSDIYLEYQRLFGTPPEPEVNVAIARFPIATPPGAWEAETRGRSVTIISSDMLFRTLSLQRLHEQLRHELFHLWIPNGVNLTGNYDWFYEGFALYQSLKLAVGLNRIRFEDFLDTLSRAHTIDTAYTQRPSLIDASRTRFSGTNTQVYARGMLVAFLVDLALLQETKGKRSVDDLLKDFFTRHRKDAAPADGNTAVLALLNANPRLMPVVKKYVTGSENIEWTAELAAAGIEDVDPGIVTSLRVKEKVGGRQKTLLDKLGYNNWRKLSRTSK